MEELLIIVDRKDNVIGAEEKLRAHDLGLLHRAFSLFIFDPEQKKLLIQQRARQKYHSGGLWSNSCCSHPHYSESWSVTISHALQRELGMALPLREASNEDSGLPQKGTLYPAGTFTYFTQYDTNAEHEIDHVFLLFQSAGDLSIQWDPSEIEELRWIPLDELDAWFQASPEQFSSWFPQAYALFKAKLQEIIL